VSVPIRRSPLPHFLYYLRTSAWNRGHLIVERLRTPRYAIASLFGIAYLGLLFSTSLFDPDLATLRAGDPLFTASAPLVLALFASWWWLWGGHTDALALTPAQVQILVPAPLRRPDLIRFRLMQVQLAIVPSALVLSYLFGRGGLPWPLRAVALWMLFTTLHLHQASASLVQASALSQGAMGWRRNRVAIVFFVLAFGTLMWAVGQVMFELRAADSVEDIAAGLLSVLASPAARIVLFPFRLVLAPTFAGSVSAWPLPAVLAFAVLFLHYRWVIRTDATFEEAAAAAGRKRAERRLAIRAGRRSKMADVRVRGDRPAPFPLSPTGTPAVALFWKNCVAFSRQMRVVSSAVIGAVLVILYLLMVIMTGSPSDAIDTLGLVLVASGAILTVFGPLGIRNDLRDDMTRFDALRSYPLSSSSIVVAEVAASTLSLTALQLALFSGGLACLAFGELVTGHFMVLLYGFAAAILVLPAVNGISMAIQNAGAVVLPAWVQKSGTRGGGIEVIGHQMLTLAFTGALLIVALTFPAVAAGVVLLRLGLGGAALSLAVIAALVTLWGELAIAFTFLGDVFEKTDPSEIAT